MSERISLDSSVANTKIGEILHMAKRYVNYFTAALC